jgi:hypothetical protein
MLEIKVSGVDGRTHQLVEDAVKVGGGKAARRQQATFCLRDQGIHEVGAVCKRGTLASWGLKTWV